MAKSAYLNSWTSVWQMRTSVMAWDSLWSKRYLYCIMPRSEVGEALFELLPLDDEFGWSGVISSPLLLLLPPSPMPRPRLLLGYYIHTFAS